MGGLTSKQQPLAHEFQCSLFPDKAQLPGGRVEAQKTCVDAKDAQIPEHTLPTQLAGVQPSAVYVACVYTVELTSMGRAVNVLGTARDTQWMIRKGLASAPQPVVVTVQHTHAPGKSPGQGEGDRVAESPRGGASRGLTRGHPTRLKPPTPPCAIGDHAGHSHASQAEPSTGAVRFQFCPRGKPGKPENNIAVGHF